MENVLRSLKRHLSNEALRGRLDIDCVSDPGDVVGLVWFVHIVKKDDQQWAKKTRII